MTGCPFGPPIPVEDNPNYPPFIDDENLAPQSYAVRVQRTEQLTLEVNRFLDINDNENLSVIWLAPTIASGLQLQTEFSVRDESANDRVEDVFYVYQSSKYVVDPCLFFWANIPELPISVLVSDGQITLNNGQYTTEDGRYIDIFTWTITFEGECL